MPYGKFRRPATRIKYYFFEIPTQLECFYEENNRKYSKYKHTFDTVVGSMPMDGTRIIIWFVHSV